VCQPQPQGGCGCTRPPFAFFAYHGIALPLAQVLSREVALNPDKQTKTRDHRHGGTADSRCGKELRFSPLRFTCDNPMAQQYCVSGLNLKFEILKLL
jgi:hypothetical protein